VIKANGYGHGSVAVAEAAMAGGATWLGVALVEEGVPFRDAHEQVAEAVRTGSFEAPEQVTECYLLGRGIDVGAAVAAAWERWS